jgi:hypothetical protein
MAALHGAAWRRPRGPGDDAARQWWPVRCAARLVHEQTRGHVEQLAFRLDGKMKYRIATRRFVHSAATIGGASARKTGHAKTRRVMPQCRLPAVCVARRPGSAVGRAGGMCLLRAARALPRRQTAAGAAR